MDEPEWLKDAIKRIESESVHILCDTPELAEEHGVRLGTTVIQRVIRPISCDMQENLDDFMAREYLRSK